MIYKDIKDELAQVAGSSGMVSTDSRLKNLVTSAQRLLVDEGNWVGMLERVTLNVYCCILTLPEQYESLWHFKNAWYPSSNVVDPWFDLQPGFVNVGYGVTHTLQDIGERAVFRQPEGRFIKAFSGDDQVITITVEGGEEIQLTPGNQNAEATKTNLKYNEITRVERPAPGKGFEIVYVDDNGVETLGGRYSGQLAIPSLRAYRTIEAAQDMAAVAVCRKKVLPIVNDQTPIIIQNRTALGFAVQAVHYNQSRDFEAASICKAKALKLLNQQNKQYHPHKVTPKMEGDFGFGDIEDV